jgi:nicotinamidase/pyrazinamidase
MKIELTSSGLTVVDIQNGFTTKCPLELPVPGGLEIIPTVNPMLELPWKRIDATQDWHPTNHCSFLGQSKNLYPPHCIQGTEGSKFVEGLLSDRFHTIWRKGFRSEFEAYAVTAEHPAFIETLRGSGIKTVVICGIATNICCYFAARDLRLAGFDVVIVTDASAGIDIPAAGLFQEATQKEGEAIGIHYLKFSELMFV